MEIDRKYMERALDLARNGLGYASPNPMVGAVIVASDGRIIGEGFHRRCGGPHAEVNAVNSVRPEDVPLLENSTVYVTLEPCSHYGKTPPCSKLLIDRKIPRVVVGAVDPFSKVSGRGIRMLREAGREVVTDVLAEESRALNCRFFTAHTSGRPFVTLKWACDRDGMMDAVRYSPSDSPVRFSGPVGTALVHRLRSTHDAILVGTRTWLADHPRLDVRKWSGKSPRRYVLSHTLSAEEMTEDVTLVSGNIDEILKQMYADGITSLLVEGGPSVLRAFLDAGLWDVARVETAPFSLADRGRAKSPDMSALTPIESRVVGANVIRYYSNNALVTPFALATF